MGSEKPQIGKYILDSLSIGMYNHPLMMIREYIQNSVDAIDEVSGQNRDREYNGKVDIQVDWRSKSIYIKDNGAGVPADMAYGTLQDIGKSLKNARQNRGFRGIGRLGGLGYCDRLEFKTKAAGERLYSVSSWDCIKLRALIAEDDSRIDIFGALKEVTTFSQDTYDGSKKDHFFEVEMGNVRSPRDILINVPEIKAYLAQVAPVPFNGIGFSFAGSIDAELRNMIPKYETYEISVNGDQVYKPYINDIYISDKHKDIIKGIEFIELRNDEQLFAYAWLANTELLGVIRTNMMIDCLRVRSGNIMIGDKLLLSDFFRERRFNNYLVGEIHVVDNNLVPNSRRDDFEDNAAKEKLLTSFVKTIGLPYSSLIRKRSAERAEQKKLATKTTLVESAKRICKTGYYSAKQKELLLAAMRNYNGLDDLHFSELVEKVGHSSHFADNLNGSLSLQRKKLLRVVVEDIYDMCTNKVEAEKIISRVARDFQ